MLKFSLPRHFLLQVRSRARKKGRRWEQSVTCASSLAFACPMAWARRYVLTLSEMSSCGTCVSKGCVQLARRGWGEVTGRLSVAEGRSDLAGRLCKSHGIYLLPSSMLRFHLPPHPPSCHWPAFLAHSWATSKPVLLQRDLFIPSPGARAAPVCPAPSPSAALKPNATLQSSRLLGGKTSAAPRGCY